MELGYELFLDRSSLESDFMVVDLLAGSAQGEIWNRLVDTGADIVHCSAFFHLFPLQQQIEVAENVAQLVKVGGVIVGRQSGSIKPGEVPAVKAGTTSFRHSVEMWRHLWETVGKKLGMTWKVSGTLDTVGLSGIKKNTVEDENSRRLLFTIERLK